LANRQYLAGSPRSLIVRVGIVAQRGNERALDIAAQLRSGIDADHWIDETTADALGFDGHRIDTFEDCDLVVSIGGDGTFLYAAHGAGSTPIVGINLGEVGFLNAVTPTEAVETVAAAVDAARDGTMSVRERIRLATSPDRSDVALDPAVNEVIVQADRRGHGGGATTRVSIDGADYLDRRADGVIVATGTGSTAYNLSEGGPLVASGVDPIIVTDMCAREGTAPLVASSDVTVRVTLDTPGVVVADGRDRVTLDAGETVRIEQATDPLRVAGPPLDFFSALDKLR